jgi:hypothetical protein
MPLRVRYPKVTGQIFDALGIYDTYNQDFGVLIAVRLFLGGSNTYSDPIPVADVDVIGGIGSGGGGSGVSSINGISGNLNIAAGSGIDVSTSGNTLTITATGGGTVTNEAIDDRVAALLQAGPNISLNYNDAANTLTISASGSGGVTSFNGRTGAVVPAPNDYSYTDIANFDVGVDNRIALIASTTQPATLFPTFNENVDDRVAALLQAGQGLTKTYNDAANSLTLAVTNANLLNKTTIGSFPPSSPVPGDIWFETSDAGGAYVGDTTAGFGQLRHGWYWWWDGSLWRSPRFRWSASASNITIANRADKWAHLAIPTFAPPGSGGFNLWFQNIRVAFYVQTVNNPSNYWTLNIGVTRR